MDILETIGKYTVFLIDTIIDLFDDDNDDWPDGVPA